MISFSGQYQRHIKGLPPLQHYNIVSARPRDISKSKAWRCRYRRLPCLSPRRPPPIKLGLWLHENFIKQVTAFMQLCIHAYTDVSVDHIHVTATAPCYIPAPEIPSAGRLSSSATSTTDESCAIRLTLEILLHRSTSSKSVILTDTCAAHHDYKISGRLQ